MNLSKLTSDKELFSEAITKENILTINLIFIQVRHYQVVYQEYL